MSGILRLESLTKGNTLKQGDLTLLKYRLFDADGDKLDISGKPAAVRLMKNDFTFIAYEKEDLTVAPDDTISFNINKILPGGLYHLEVIVDDRYIFPSRSDEGKFNVDKSSLGAELNIIENAGIDAVVRKAVDLINEDPSLIIDEDKLISEIIANTSVGSIEEYYQEYRDAIKEYADLKPKAVSAVSKSEEALTRSQNALHVANGIDTKATNALSLSESADALSKSVQEQFNQVVIDGDSSVEAAQARVDASGNTNATLKSRLDKEHNEVTTQLAQTNWNTFKRSAVNHSKIEPTIVWIDDDADRGFYETIKPILEKYNIVATSAVITGANHGFPIETPKTIDGESFVETTDPMDWEQIKELRDSGLAEFVSHTHSNIDLRDHTPEENYEDLKKSQKVLRELGLSSEHFVYPYGAVDERTEPIVRQLFKSGFSTRSGIVSFPMNQFAIQRFSIGASTTLAQINEKTDEALAGGNLVVWVSHVRNFDKPKVESAIEYALSKGFKFKTVTEAINEFGNILDFDNTKIGATGQVRSRILGSYRYTGIDEPINNSTRSELRPVNTTTLGRLRTAEANDSNLTAESFAGNQPLGHYWTYIDTTDSYNFQRALNLNENIESIRQVNGDTGEWGAWEDVGRVEYLRSLPEGRKPNEYSRNKITIENVGLSNISGYNVPSPGVLVTIDQRLATDGGTWTTQEFIPIYRSGVIRPRMYRVSTSANGDYWSPWETNQQTKYVSRNRSWLASGILANSTRTFVTANANYTKDLAVETAIKEPLPAGLIVQSMIVEDGRIETRVANITSERIEADIVVDLIIKSY